MSSDPSFSWKLPADSKRNLLREVKQDGGLSTNHMSFLAHIIEDPLTAVSHEKSGYFRLYNNAPTPDGSDAQALLFCPDSVSSRFSLNVLICISRI